MTLVYVFLIHTELILGCYCYDCNGCYCHIGKIFKRTLENVNLKTYVHAAE